ncbi:MAG: TrpB-like pyridoxal phosphate-dependent enzyme [Candidatus Lokiarchaeota archaeon]|nr:TrpB-like pyridoxal phosphate-dependent enzyme [Candidatus Lokiarchaeota archaeon]MBD3198704.1 TrpB-like pyridoxal phosphate-dependent enzyme [Candidatus Lokiarchaeota archaeon]
MSDYFNGRVLLDPKEVPTEWINILPDLPTPMTPLINPMNGKPAPFEMATAIFPTECVVQEVSQEPLIPIPKKLREIYARSYRPTPLQRALGLEKALEVVGDDIQIFYKNESVSPTGSHKPNTALAQAYYAKSDGINELVTETGAGQWGSALSFGSSLFNIKCTVYMVRASFIQKPGRKILMRSYNAEVHASPSRFTESGKSYYNEDPDHPGSLGIAISEAVEHSLTSDKIRYSLGSVLNFVCLHQTIIGQETKIQLRKIGITEPDIIIGCMGGGSNFSGLAIPYARDKVRDVLPNLEIIGVEPRACPSVCKGKYLWDYGDSAKKAPILKMHTLGHNFIPSPIHAGGLRYHGIAPIVSNLYNKGIIKAVMHHQLEVIEAGLLFAKSEGIIPAPETNHAVKEAIDQALLAKENNEKKVIVFNFSGHGYFDLLAYKEYMTGDLENFELSEKKIIASINDADMPKIDESQF